MKRTTGIVLGLVGSLVVIVVVLAVVARVTLGNLLADGGGAERVTLSGNRIERSYDVGDFDSIEVRGGWQIRIAEGTDYDVRVETDEALFEHTTIERNGDTLEVATEQDWYWDEDARMRVSVTMPALAALEVAGGADVNIDGFTGDTLVIDISGAANVTGGGSTYDRLEVEIDGAANVNFRGSSVTSADIRLDGAGNVELTMNGGELTGRIGGVGSVTYGGRVSREAVRIEGLGSVERR